MITKFEALGIFISIGLMAVALFFLRIDKAQLPNEVGAASQSAAVVVVDENRTDNSQALSDALTASYSGKKLDKLVVDDVVIGSGKEATSGDSVTLNYIGRLENGQEFDNSYTRGEPITFKLGEGKVIPGWEEGIVGMKEGGQRVLVVPPEMAYKNKNFGPIPANSTLLFIVELISVN